MNTNKVAELSIFFFVTYLKIFMTITIEIDIVVTPLQLTYDPRNLDTPTSCVSVYLTEFVQGVAQGYMYRHLCVSVYVSSHTVGVNRSSSLAINHWRQLTRA